MILRAGSKSNDICPFETDGRRYRHRGEGHMKTKAETGMITLQAIERQELPEAGRCRDPPPEPPEEAWPCRHPDDGLLASRTVRE